MTQDDPIDPIDPINSIEWRDATDLRANWWNPNRVHRAELQLLTRSLLTTGWIQPILANTTGLIIDGFHRWRVSQDSPEVAARWGGRVPVAVLPVDDAEAMLLTVRINRAKGTHVAIEMSRLVKELVNGHGYSREEVGVELGAHRDEVDLLLQDDVFTKENIKGWAYSKAWYPEAVPVGEQGDVEDVTV